MADVPMIPPTGRTAKRRRERMPTIDAPTARKTLAWAMFLAAYVSLWIVVFASGS